MDDKWIVRANEAADRADRYKRALEVAMNALDIVVHCGRRGDEHVDVSQTARERVKFILGDK